MERTTAETQPVFTRPLRQLVPMLIVIALVAAGVWLAWSKLSGVFLAKPWLNSTIGLVFAIGVASCFLQVFGLNRSITWVRGFLAGTPEGSPADAPSLLAPLAALLSAHGPRGGHITPSSARSILESVDTRMEESSDVAHYLGNLLIFLGLLGTFYGLATTVPALVDTIRSLAPQEGTSGMAAFDTLMKGLEKQLGGMGTAFSSSLLGLAGSLVVGLLQLFAGHGQNRFYRELEEWLSTITRIGFATSESDTDGMQHAATAALLGQIEAQMVTMQALSDEAQEARAQATQQTAALTTAVSRLAARLEAEQGQTAQLARIADGQERLISALTGAETGAHVDAESRMRLRSIDVQLLRILEEISAGRQESMADLRTDLSALTAAVRQLTRGSAPRG